MYYNKGDKVVVTGLDMAFVFDCYLKDSNGRWLAKLFIEGQSSDSMHHVIHARPEVLLPNNHDSMLKEGWV